MNDVIGIAWFKDELTYRGRLRSLPIPGICPPHMKTGKLLSEGNAKRLRVLAILLFAQTSIRKHLPIGATDVDFKPIPRAERRSSTMLNSNIGRPAKERSSNSS